MKFDLNFKLKFKRFAMTVVATHVAFAQVASSVHAASDGVQVEEETTNTSQPGRRNVRRHRRPINHGLMGTGAIGGGLMTCSYDGGYADGSYSEVDTRSENERELAKKELLLAKYKKQIRALDKEKDQIVRSSFGNFKPIWLTVIRRHMDGGMNCGLCDSGGTPTAPPQPPPFPQPPPQQPPSAPPSTPEEKIPAPPAPPAPPTEKPSIPPSPETPTDEVPEDGKKKKTNRRPKVVSQNDQTARSSGGRFPAAEQGRPPVLVTPSVPAAAQVETNDDPWASEPTEYSTTAGSNSSYVGDSGGPVRCYSRSDGRPYQDNTWLPERGGICRPDGNISASACRIAGYNVSASREAESDCVSGLQEYRELAKEYEELQSEARELKEEIRELSREVRREAREGRRDDDDTEAGTRVYEQPRQKTNWGRQILGILGGGLVGYFTEKNNRGAYNDHAEQLGMRVPEYRSNGAGLMAGLATYGAITGSTNGGYGCGNMVGNDGMSSFNNPYMTDYNNMGGGMYNGRGRWGVAGPWGNDSNMMSFMNRMRGSSNSGGFGNDMFGGNQFGSGFGNNFGSSFGNSFGNSFGSGNNNWMNNSMFGNNFGSGNNFSAIQSANQFGRNQQNQGLMSEYNELMCKMQMMNGVPNTNSQCNNYGSQYNNYFNNNNNSQFGNNYLPYGR